MAAAPAMASLGASQVMGGRQPRAGAVAEPLRVAWKGREYGSGVGFSFGTVVCRGVLGRRNLVAARGLRGCSSALAGARVRRLLLASRHLTYAVSVSTESTESSVAVKALDGDDGGSPPVSSKPVMTLQAPEVNAPESDSVGLKPPPLKPAPKPVARPNEIAESKPQEFQGSGGENGAVSLKGPPRPVLRLNRSGPSRPQQGESPGIPSLGQILENVEKLGPREAGAGPRGAGRGSVRARPLTTQPGAWKAGDKIRTKAEREKEAAVAAEAAAAAAAAAAERRADVGDNDDAQASTSDSDIPRTQRPRTQLNTLAKPIVRPAPIAARKGPVLKDVGSSGPRLRDAGAGPILKDVGAGPRSQSSRSSTPPPAPAGPAGPPKPFAKAAIKVGIILAFVIFIPLYASFIFMNPALQAHDVCSEW